MISNDGSRASIRSIEHSLELERQLALEAETPPHSPPGHGIRPQSLDPSILASLVTSLTAERDSLASALEASKEREEQLRVELHRHLERVATQDEELEGLKSKNVEAEESIALLRSKVEDSRRALMRLQTENRRVHGAGNMSVDLSRTSSFSFGGPPSAKRASFTPLAGSPRGHARRPSNISTTDSPLDSLQSMRSRQLPAAEVLPDGSSLLSLPVNHPEYAESTVQSPRSPYLRPDVDAQQREIQTLRSMLEEIRSELAEANDAREASDTCVKALREFITEHNIGTSPLPAMPQVPASRTSTQSKPATDTGSTRWGFGLWRTSESSPPSPPSRSSVSQLGGIFGSRQSGSVSIVSSTVQDHPQATHDQASDSSSVESPEPASPSDSQRISRGAIISAPSALAHPSAKIPTESPGPITVITL